MSWLYYLLEANLYLILFYGFYRLFLHRETFYGLNRYYLIFSSILAFILPFFQVGFLKAPIIEQINIVPTEMANPLLVTGNLPVESYQASTFTIYNIIIAIYILVVTVFIIKLFFGLAKIIRMLKLPSLKLENGVKVIDLKDSKIAFSFFNLLFLDPLLPEKSTIIKHELVHIKQWHSLDVLLFEIIQIINWFNPVSYLIKKDIKLIHEYLADEETAKSDIDKYRYAMFLIQNSTGAQNLTLTNPIFSSSILKKRINMLNQKKSTSWVRLRMLLVLPIIAGILCISSTAFTKEYGFVVFFSKKIKPLKFAEKAQKENNTLKAKSSNTLASKKHQNRNEPPIIREKKIREVFTSSQLIVTELKPSETSKDSLSFTAKLKDCFKVIEYDNKTGRSKIILNWALCPEGECPEMKQFKEGTPEYHKLSELIAKSTPLKITK